MSVFTILSLIQQSTALVGVVAELVENAAETLSTSDAQKLAEALAELQTKNDETYSRVVAKLSKASQT